VFERLTAGLKTLFAPQWGDFWPQDQPPYSNQAGLAPIRVTADNALTFSAYYLGVRALSEDLAKLPLKVYLRRDDGGKEPDAKHSLYPVLHDVANPEMTAFVWREVSMGHLISWGNCYSEIVRNRLGEVVELWPLRPDRVRVMRDDRTDRKFYRVSDRSGSWTDLAPRDIFHVPGLGYDGNVGYSVLSMMARSIGLGLSAERYAENFWNNGARPGGILNVPKDLQLSDDRAATLRGQFAASHEGLGNAQRFAILRDGITFQDIGIPNDDAQFIETRGFQVNEVARFMRIPPHKLMDLSRATFSNIEQQSLEYVQDALSGWAVRWESQIKKDLIGVDDPHFAEHLFDALLRGDTLSQVQALWIELQAGAINQDEWRAIRNRNPLPDATGQVYLRPANLVPLEVPDITPKLIPTPEQQPAASSEPPEEIAA
jgi:HK97 family phage portal protein